MTKWYRFIFDDSTIMDLDFHTVEAAERHAQLVQARFYTL